MRVRQRDLNRALRILGILTGVALLTRPAAAEAIVLSSSSPDVYPHTELQDDDTLKLEEGEEVNLLLRSDGSTERTKRVTGPFDGPVKSLYKNKGVVDVVYDTVRGMWITGGRSTGGTAGSRGAVPVGSKDWRAIQVIAGSREPVYYCVGKGSTPVLTRGTKMDGRALRITDSTGQSQRVEVDWAMGAGELAWPSAMPPKDGRTYSITNSGIVIEVTLEKVDPGSLEGERALETLAKYKCTVQLAAWLKENG